MRELSGEDWALLELETALTSALCNGICFIASSNAAAPIAFVYIYIVRKQDHLARARCKRVAEIVLLCGAPASSEQKNL